ncbi:MAG: GNAT family N-acetyltransferase [Bacillota bacterium]
MSQPFTILALAPGESDRVTRAIPFEYTTSFVYRLQEPGTGVGFVLEPVLLDEPATVRHSYALFQKHAGDSRVLVAESGACPVGVIEFSWVAWHNLVRVWNLIVHPGHQRRGIGTALMAAAQAWAGSMGARGLYVETQTTNAPAIAFCRALGLDLWGLCDRFYSNRDRERDEVCLWFGWENPGAVPTPVECHRLLERYRVHPGIVAHGRLTAEVAALLAAGLRQAGVPINTQVVRAGALLHDIGKAVDPQHHHRASRLVLESEGWPVLGPVAERHLTGLILTGEGPQTWEEKLVFYADKVCTGKVLSLQERVEDLCLRYPGHAAEFRQALPAILALEEEIFQYLPWGPEDLVNRLEESRANPGRAGQ